ncbi:CBD9-like protein, partial [Thozetella sp. PMI_491]
ITYSLAIPDKGTAPFDIFLSITAPVSLSWVGLAIGGNMVGDPLVALLPPVSNRIVANAYSSSHRNSAHWTINALCQNCSSWDGGAVYPNGTNTFGWAASDTPISNNASYDAQLQFHSRGYGRFQLDLSKARM